MSTNAERRIIVVDDELYVCNAIRRTLRREGYDVFTTTDAHEALDKMKAEPFDLIISDHLMPTMTGLELLKLVRDRHPDTLRLMLTGHADMQTAIDAINHGEIYRFLTKPWDDLELKVTLSLAFEQADLQKENRRLLAMVRAQQQQMDKLQREHPGLFTVRRDETGAVLLDA